MKVTLTSEEVVQLLTAALMRGITVRDCPVPTWAVANWETHTERDPGEVTIVGVELTISGQAPLKEPGPGKEWP